MYHARWDRHCVHAPEAPSLLITRNITMYRSWTKGEISWHNLITFNWNCTFWKWKYKKCQFPKLIFLISSGFSYVDLVEGVKDGHFYALKRILCHDREGRQEAQTEVDMHQIFNHPNILSLVAHTFIDRGGKTEAWLLLPYMRVSWCKSWFVQNYLKGSNLTEICLCEQKGSLWSILEKLRDKGGSMPEKQILQIFHGICSGLKAIHEKGYAHR